MNTEIKPWSVIGSEYLLRDRWITVRADRCRMPDGTPVEPYYVLEYRDWVHMVVFDPQDRILVTRLYRHGNGEICLEIPAGTMEDGDVSPEAAARREVLEETGYTADHFTLVGDLTPNSATHNNRVHCFAAFNARPVQSPAPDASEEIGFGFMPEAELMAAIAEGRFRQALHIAAIFLALQHAGRLVLTPNG